jgi:FkbM family methyltransferase
MKSWIKKVVRQILIKLEIPVTKNIEYDIFTGKILRKVLHEKSNCVDVGAHKGEILDEFIALAGSGNHFAFEPIPAMYKSLASKYERKAQIFPFALSDHDGITEFNLVLDDPAYSGLKQREYKTADTRVEKIEVEVRTLDGVLSARQCKIDLIKIDVEGGEFGVLKGATQILEKDKPVIIFEFGKGASEYYGTKPEELFGFFAERKYLIYTLKKFHINQQHLDVANFVKVFNDRSDYYFIATVKAP